MAARATALPRFLRHTTLQRIPAHLASDFQVYLSDMDFAQDLASGVTPFAYDPIPEVWKGGRRCEGWKCLFEVDTDRREYKQASNTGEGVVGLGLGWTCALRRDTERVEGREQLKREQVREQRGGKT